MPDFSSVPFMLAVSVVAPYSRVRGSFSLSPEGFFLSRPIHSGAFCVSPHQVYDNGERLSVWEGLSVRVEY